MKNELLQHIELFVTLDEKSRAKILSCFDVIKVKKKEILHPANSRCDTLFFVSQGCLRAFIIDTDGIEKTIQFALENWWITDFLAFRNRQSSEVAIQAVESSHVYAISRDRYEQLFVDFPELENYFRSIWEISYGATVNRVKYIFSHSKEEIFYRFSEQYPEFANRVPQYMLATFLGLTPEYLSKLRAKKLS